MFELHILASFYYDYLLVWVITLGQKTHSTTVNLLLNFCSYSFSASLEALLRKSCSPAKTPRWGKQGMFTKLVFRYKRMSVQRNHPVPPVVCLHPEMGCVYWSVWHSFACSSVTGFTFNWQHLIAQKLIWYSTKIFAITDL